MHSAYSVGDLPREHRIGGLELVALHHRAQEELRKDEVAFQLPLCGISGKILLALNIYHISNPGKFMDYPTKCFYLGDVIGKDRRLLSLMKPIELGNVIHLHVVFNAISETRILSVQKVLIKHEVKLVVQVSHAMTSWSIPVILPLYKIIRIVILEFLLKWQRVKFTTKCKLAIDFFLTNIEVLNIEKS